MANKISRAGCAKHGRLKYRYTVELCTFIRTLLHNSANFEITYTGCKLCGKVVYILEI